MSDELRKHTLNLFKGDVERLQEMFPDLGAGAVIRRLVRSFIQKSEAEANARPEIKDIEL